MTRVGLRLTFPATVPLDPPQHPDLKTSIAPVVALAINGDATESRNVEHSAVLSLSVGYEKRSTEQAYQDQGGLHPKVHHAISCTIGVSIPTDHPIRFPSYKHATLAQKISMGG
jgi:hypothetical protein